MNRDRLLDLSQPNPFVVLADMTIAFSFILLIFSATSIANSAKLLEQGTKLYRQNKILRDLDGAIQATARHFGLETLDDSSKWDEPASGNDPGHSRRWRICVRTPAGNGVPLADIYLNGSFLRVMLYPRPSGDGARTVFYEPDSDRQRDIAAGDLRLTPYGKEVYKALLAIASDRFLRGDISYVFLHGVGRDHLSAQDLDDKAVSLARAQYVFQLMKDEGLVWVEEEVNRLPASKAQQIKSAGVDSKYSIALGTGHSIYVSEEGFGPAQKRGATNRVDLLLFFADFTEARLDARTVLRQGSVHLPVGAR